MNVCSQGGLSLLYEHLGVGCEGLQLLLDSGQRVGKLLVADDRDGLFYPVEYAVAVGLSVFFPGNHGGSSPESLCRGDAVPWRREGALCACSGDRGPGDAVDAEDASRWRVMMISIEVHVST
ncbi:hypothetical protein EYF80_023914 [Liparis tanakae]|uniref:Uncharacterized protein n=1 Tax=Liparis tanakae TaxID=230148 RepID=A0A4Z2HLU5_9TELE|nr:hypothetical protein EYF80_023914 [Liparis tanakae]